MSAGDIEDAFAALAAEQTDEEVFVVLGARVLVANVNLPDLGRLAVSVLVAHALGRGAERACPEHRVDHPV